MVSYKIWVSIVVVACFSLYIPSSLNAVLTLLSFISTLILYILCGLISFIVAIIIKKPKRKMHNVPPKPSMHLYCMTLEKLKEFKFIPKKGIKHKALISRNVDDMIEELIKLLLRDYVNSWYNNVVKKQSMFCNNLKPLIREMLFTFRDRCQKIDSVKFITSDIVIIITEHLQALKNATLDKGIVHSPEDMRPYKIYSFLQRKETELDYLRQICEFLLITLLPTEYAKSNGVRSLLREVFANTVFYNVVDKICDPDTINMRLISYLENQQHNSIQNSQPYSVAETYEDFIKMIKVSGSIENLLQWRYYIVSEIMHATTSSNLKRSKGLDADKELNTTRTNKGVPKGVLLEARNLGRYLNQLRYAKNLCERRINILGGSERLSSSQNHFQSMLDMNHPLPGQKVISMNVIMQSKICRHHFSMFLQKEDMHSLIGFWEAVEEMKTADKNTWHQIGNDIVQMYINNNSSGVRLSKNILKGIEEFMMANKGPEAFYWAQDEVFKILEEDYYASFIVSGIYHKMVTEAANKGMDFIQGLKDEMNDEVCDKVPTSENILKRTNDSDISLFDHTSHARAQLKDLQAKLNDKIQAFSALKNMAKCDRKMINKLDKEIQDLCLEQNMLQNHIEKTELWIKYLGLWQASVVQLEILKENDKNVPYCNVMVQLSNESGHPDSCSVGWVVSRSLNSFHSLHQKLVPAASWLKKIELPSKPRFRSLDNSFLEKSKISLQSFLSAVTKDDSLNKSEALYNFLNPSPEYMKHPPVPQKKPLKNSLSNIFKNFQSNTEIDDSEDVELLFLDDVDCKEDSKDSIAESLYILIGEIFEIKGMFSFLRRTLIIFVQYGYGKTINKQLRELVSYVLSEPMLLSYLQTFRDTMWPTSPQQRPQRSTEEKEKTRKLARQMVQDNIPGAEVLNNLLGQQNTTKGIIKLFDSLQEKAVNKQLLYNILEAFLFQYSPELQKVSRKHKNS